MLSAAGPIRFVPRQGENAAERRRYAALRAAMDDLTNHFHKVQKEQEIQLQRIADIQKDLDELKGLLRNRA